MKDEKSNRSRLVGLRFTADEFTKLSEWRLKSTTPEMSEYIRRVLFGRPITVHQRNQSLDDFMAEMMRLRSELNSIGNNFNQTVKKLHLLKESERLGEWTVEYERDANALLRMVAAIKEKINQIANEWLQ
jgi:MobC-like protein